MRQTAENFILPAMLLAAMCGGVLAQDLPQERVARTEISTDTKSKEFTSVNAGPATRPEGHNGALLLTGLGLVLLTLRRREPVRILSRHD